MEKTKVMHIAQAAGGVERYLEMFMKYYSKDNYENYLVVSKDYEKDVKYFKSLGVKVILVDMCREIDFIKDIKSIFSVYNIMKNIRPDIVYSHSSKAGAIARIPAKLLRIKSIYNSHGWAFDMDISSNKKKIYTIVEKVLAKITDRIVMISQYELNIAKDNKIGKLNQYKLIENGIDLGLVNEYESKSKILNKYGWDSNSIIVGMVARVSKQKSPNTFIEVAKILSDKYENVKFILVGDGDLKLDIEYLIKKYGLEEKVVITGWIDNVREYIGSFDFALLTSLWEGFGLVVPEYMSEKKPVVASDVGGISYIIDDGVDGFLVCDNNVDKYVEKIELLINNSDLKNSIEKNAYNKAINRYDFKRVIEEHEKLFEEIIKGDK